MKKWWRVWAKALGEKSGKSNRKQTPLQRFAPLFLYS